MNTKTSIIDFTNYIIERADHFTGREWVFQAVNDWLADSNGSRFFLIAGEPGCGKTAIASRLVQFSQGIAAPPVGLAHLTPGFLSAMHFCSARDSRWINPYTFAESLAMQLAQRYPVYAKAMAEKGGDRQIRIEVQQRIEQGQAIGVMINRLEISGVSPEDAFNRVVREPLEVLFQSEFDQQVVILIDGLDESLSYSGNVNIISLLAHLDALPPGVRFILTSRQDSRVGHAFLDAEELVLSAATYERHNQDDIKRYLQSRLSEDRALAEKTIQLEPADIAQMIEIISYKAEGNFLYTRFLLDAMAKGMRPLTELDGLPEGLDALYFESLNRVVTIRQGDWHKGYAPLIGILAVAQQSPTLAQLQSFTGQAKTSLLKHLDDLWQFIEEMRPADKGEQYYRLYHQSIIHFFQSQSLFLKKKELRNTFYLPMDEWHKALADWCEKGNLAIIWNDSKLDLVEQGRRLYARQYYVIHLYLAHEWQRLFAVLDEGEYGRIKIHDDPSMRSYAEDLDLGRQAAAWEEWTLDEGLRLLPNLWRYALLRCSLTSRADKFPSSVFRLLILLGKEREALNLAELLTNPFRKAETLLDIAKIIGKQPGREQQQVQILLKAHEAIGTIRAVYRDNVELLCQVWSALAGVGEEEKAKVVEREGRKYSAS